MKPNPLSPLNHLTVPLGMDDHLWTRGGGSGGSALSVLPSRGSGPADRDNVCAHSSISMNALDGRGLRRRGHRGAIRRAPESSHHFQGDRAQEVALADLDAAMAQDRVSRGDVEIEIRQHEVVEIVVAAHLALIWPDGKIDLTVGRAV